MIELLWINGYMFWHEIYMIAYSVHILFRVIFAKFITVCVLSYLFISKHGINCYRNHPHLFNEVSKLHLCCWSWCLVWLDLLFNYFINNCPCVYLFCLLSFTTCETPCVLMNLLRSRCVVVLVKFLNVLATCRKYGTR